LVEGDDLNDPIGDAVRAIVDGHIVLSRKLAHRGHFPAIDILQSTSRVMRQVVSEDQMHLAARLRELTAIYRESEDLINIGAYRSGSSAKIDAAIRAEPLLEQFLKQGVEESSDLNHALQGMLQVGV
jgi:flagellum-specific ATP synthase